MSAYWAEFRVSCMRDTGADTKGPHPHRPRGVSGSKFEQLPGERKAGPGVRASWWSETTRDRGVERITRREAEEEEEERWWGTRSGRRWRGLRLEGSCAEDEEVSEEGEGARWHGTYEYPRRLQQRGKRGGK